MFGHPDLVAKVIRPAERYPHLAHLLDVVRASVEGVGGVCRMHESIRLHAGGDVVGYLMEFVDGPPLDKATFASTLHRVSFARDVARTFWELEERGVFYADAHDENVRQRARDGRPVLIDLDSVSLPELTLSDGTKVARYFAKGVHEWLAPELCGNPDPVHNTYTLAHTTALVAWKVLKGQHPAAFVDLDGRPQPLAPFVTNLDFGRFAATRDLRLVPVDAGIPFAELTPRLQARFTAAFTLRGLRDPMNRPPTREIAEALAEYAGQLTMARKRRYVAVGLGAAALAAAVPLAWSMGSVAGPASPPSSPSPTLTERAGPHPVNTNRPPLWRALEDDR